MLDTGPLSTFARSQWLGVLKMALKGHAVVIPDVVTAEIRNGASQHHHLRALLEADWIRTVDLDSPEQLAAFARYESSLVGASGRNRGECGVLALTETTPNAIAVVDDRAAKNVARSRGVRLCGSLGLLCDAIRRGHHRRPGLGGG